VEGLVQGEQDERDGRPLYLRLTARWRKIMDEILERGLSAKA